MSEIIGVFGINWKLLLVQAVNFGILLLVLWHFLYKPVIRMLAERREVVAKGVIDAEHAAAERARAEEERTAVLTAATKDADTLIARAKERGEAKEQEILLEAQKKSDRLLAEAALKAEEEKRRALVESKEEIARMAILGAKRLLEKKTL